MRFLVFLIMILLAVPLGIVCHEVLDFVVRPDRFAPLLGLDVEYDGMARVGAASMTGAFFALTGFVLFGRTPTRVKKEPKVTKPGPDSAAIRAERDYWRSVVSDLLAAQNVSVEDRERLLDTIRDNLAAQESKTESGNGKPDLVAKR